MPEPARAKKSQIEMPSLEERIRRRAYELYIEGGNQSGSEVDDWLQAEEEIQVAEEQAVGKGWLQQVLPERYQRVVSLYYTNEMTMKEIGGILGINESRVSQMYCDFTLLNYDEATPPGAKQLVFHEVLDITSRPPCGLPGGAAPKGNAVSEKQAGP